MRAESDLQGKNSVYDFLYHDVHRIGSFLSQFDPNGHLQSSTRSNSLSQNRSASEDKSLTGRLPAIAEGKTTNSHSNSEINKNDSSKTYDPLWQNSLALLDYLEQNNLINRDLHKSRIGQFVLISGKLFMFDMEYMQELIQKPTLKKSFIDGYIAGRVNRKEAMHEASVVLDVLATLPGSIQCRLLGNGFSTWSTLQTSGLSLSADDLLLKHGTCIGGEWYMLGILDAIPDNGSQVDLSFLPLMQKGLADFSSSIRPEFGRSSDYFGITPLLVFREVSGN